MSDLTALVFNIQGFSIQDGPGVRTTVFMKGCPLSCQWCANPESQVFRSDVIHVPSSCVHCYRCVSFCTKGAVKLPEKLGDNPIFDHDVCVTCEDQDMCEHSCYEAAIERVGKPMTVDEVMDVILHDEPFFSNGGGITVSGGEPLMHPEFLEELFSECQDNYIHTAIETCGYVAWDKFEPVLRYTDLALYDVKHMDPVAHKELTGVSNELILDNLRKIMDETNTEVIIRIPVIPGANDTDENMDATARYAKEIGAREIHILPYHRMGMGKYTGLGREYPLGEEVESPSDERMEVIRDIFRSYGLICKIGGTEKGDS